MWMVVVRSPCEPGNIDLFLDSVGCICASRLIRWFRWINSKINHRKLQISNAFEHMRQIEPAWKESNLEQIVRQKFYLFQDAWSRQDINCLRHNLKFELFSVWDREISTQKSNHQRNYFEGVEILSVRFVAVRNFVNDENDEFTACIDAECAEKMVSIDPLFAADDIKNLKKLIFGSFGPLSVRIQDGCSKMCFNSRVGRV